MANAAVTCARLVEHVDGADDVFGRCRQGTRSLRVHLHHRCDPDDEYEVPSRLVDSDRNCLCLLEPEGDGRFPSSRPRLYLSNVNFPMQRSQPGTKFVEEPNSSLLNHVKVLAVDLDRDRSPRQDIDEFSWTPVLLSPVTSEQSGMPHSQKAFHLDDIPEIEERELCRKMPGIDSVRSLPFDDSAKPTTTPITPRDNYCSSPRGDENYSEWLTAVQTSTSTSKSSRESRRKQGHPATIGVCSRAGAERRLRKAQEFNRRLLRTTTDPVKALTILIPNSLPKSTASEGQFEKRYSPRAKKSSSLCDIPGVLSRQGAMEILPIIREI